VRRVSCFSVERASCFVSEDCVEKRDEEEMKLVEQSLFLEPFLIFLEKKNQKGNKRI